MQTENSFGVQNFTIKYKCKNLQKSISIVYFTSTGNFTIFVAYKNVIIVSPNVISEQQAKNAFPTVSKYYLHLSQLRN